MAKVQTTQAEMKQQLQELTDTWQARQAATAAAAQQVQAQLRQDAEFSQEELKKESENVEEMALALRRVKDDMDALQRQSREKESELERTCAQKDHAHSTAIAEMKAQHSALMAKLHQQYTEKEQTTLTREMELREEIQDLKAQVTTLRARQEENDGRLVEARGSLKRKREEIQGLKAQQTKNEEVRHQLKYLRASYDQLQTQSAAYQKDRSNAIAKLDAMQRDHLVEKNKLEIRCGTQAEKVREMEASTAHLRAQLGKQTQEVQRLKRVFDS